MTRSLADCLAAISGIVGCEAILQIVDRTERIIVVDREAFFGEFTVAVGWSSRVKAHYEDERLPRERLPMTSAGGGGCMPHGVSGASATRCWRVELDVGELWLEITLDADRQCGFSPSVKASENRACLGRLRFTRAVHSRDHRSRGTARGRSLASDPPG